MKNLKNLRKEYNASPLSHDNLKSNPIDLFAEWFEEASTDTSSEANAMVLSTWNRERGSSSRVVLLKSFSYNGFTFFTNYNSRKAIDISLENRVSLLFFWHRDMRQVRVEGLAFKTSRDESVDYFNSRPALSRASSALSKQSQPLENKEEFDAAVTELSQRDLIECPLHWGGYRVVPEKIEFWQGAPGRSHDRFSYECGGEDTWRVIRLYP